jgi:hypothetical protein
MAVVVAVSLHAVPHIPEELDRGYIVGLDGGYIQVPLTVPHIPKYQG